MFSISQTVALKNAETKKDPRRIAKIKNLENKCN